MSDLMRSVLEHVLQRSQSSPASASPPVGRDDMTGLLTKQGLMQAATRILHRTIGPPCSYAAITLDMDYFKQINDTIGHKAGDLVLQEVARRVRASVRTEDLVARTGGDEFAILMPDISNETAILNIADRVLNAVSQPIIDDGIELYPSLTVGIAVSDASSHADFEETLHHSDLALQQAKTVCRGTVHFFDRNMAGELDRRREIEYELRSAPAKGELRLHYQPIYDLQKSVISHLEGLVRWQHPTLGLVPPADFIPIAEASGIIQSIGVWVLSQVFTDLRRLDASGFDDISVNINLSPEQLKISSIVKTICDISDEHPDMTGRVALEVTEDVVVDERYQMNAKLEALRDAGFSIFLDDFGTGNASIGRLRNFRFNGIKIDRSLITNLDQNDADLAIVKSILLLADSLGVTVVAEGVETQTCLDILAAEQCRYAQGYFISKPHPLEETLQTMRDRLETSCLADVVRLA